MSLPCAPTSKPGLSAEEEMALLVGDFLSEKEAFVASRLCMKWGDKPVCLAGIAQSLTIIRSAPH